MKLMGAVLKFFWPVDSSYLLLAIATSFEF